MTRLDLLDLLVRVSEVLDRYSDVIDVDGAQSPRPNAAMALKADVEAAIEALEREQAATCRLLPLVLVNDHV